jgi:hypothetical protein
MIGLDWENLLRQEIYLPKVCHSVPTLQNPQLKYTRTSPMEIHIIFDSRSFRRAGSDTDQRAS